MEESYQPSLKAQVLTDESHRIRAIEHTDDNWESSEPALGGLETAVRYLRDVASKYDISTAQFDNLESKVGYLEPREQPAEYRLSEEKRMFDSEVFGFTQTIHNVPVWQAGLKVAVKQGPNRVIMSEDTTQFEAQVDMPSETSIQRYKKILKAINIVTMQRTVVQQHPELTGEPLDEALNGVPEQDADDNVRQLRDLFGGAKIRPIRGRFWIYRYNAEERLPRDNDVQAAAEIGPGGLEIPFPIPPVNGSIQSGNYYMVAEITFESPADIDCTVWRALVELETNSVLYLRALSASVNCMVYKTDPISKTGTTNPTSSSDNLTLNPHRDDVRLQSLYQPVSGRNYLIGTYAYVRQVEGPYVGAPVEPIGNDFDYSVRTNHYASTSGYFHIDRIFRFMDYLGFSPMVYFSHTNFPVHVDIRCSNKIDAHLGGSGTGGIGHVGYGLMDLTDTANPLGRACDPRVHLHEVLGHGTLFETIEEGTFKFAHSAGDALSMIYFDPESRCKRVDGSALGKSGDLRFTYVPWHPTLDRRADRDVAAGWSWGGSNDKGGYPSEEILCTTLFNFYRSIGGDHPFLGHRSFASRMAIYLILRAINNLTPATNPRYARDFARHLMAADQFNWTTHGIFGGAYSKVIRWVFEQQGEYQTPLVTREDPRFGTIKSPGDPPKFDVYIDDGRKGGYAFQRNFWSTRSVWNRRAPDGKSGHQNSKLGTTNYAYVRVKNRGTQTANSVSVRGYHSRPGAGFSWPADFQSMGVERISSLQGNDAEEVLVGPFRWTPTENGYGLDSLLMVVHMMFGDTSNAYKFRPGESVPAWRLVPNDNNIAMRTTSVVPLGDGTEGLVEALDGIAFTVQNPNPDREHMTFEVSVPAFLREKGWNLEIVDVGNGFYLPSGDHRDVSVKVLPGRSLTQEELQQSGESSIEIEVLAGEKTIGGLTFSLDPSMSRPSDEVRLTGTLESPIGEPPAGESQVVDAAQRLAQCLGVTKDISNVDVKEIIVGLKVKESKE